MNEQVLNTILSMISTSPFTLFLLWLWFKTDQERREIGKEYSDHLKRQADQAHNIDVGKTSQH